MVALLPQGLQGSLPEGAVLGCQWPKARKPIRGVNGSRRVIEVSEGMVGRKMRLVVTVTAPGYVTYTVAAPKTRVVEPTGWTGKTR